LTGSLGAATVAGLGETVQKKEYRMDNLRVFANAGEFCAEIPGLLAEKEKAAVFAVALDVVKGVPVPLRGGQLDAGSARMTMFALVGDYAMAGMDPLAMLLGATGAPAALEGEHPVDVTVRENAIPADTVSIVYAGGIEWQSDLAATKRLLAALPQGKTFILACTCAQERKVAKVAAEKLGVAGIVFTEDCGGEEAMQTILQAFVDADTGRVA
jgi:hypothetical protein